MNFITPKRFSRRGIRRKPMSLKKFSYAKAGVSIDVEDAAIGKLKKWARKTLAFQRGRYDCVLEAGYFASVLRLTKATGLAVSTDGVGTKLLVAEQTEKYDTVGIDCIAMNANDVLCVGAEPFTFLDYLAVEKLRPEICDEIGKGLYEGAKQANVTISGGETAQIREMIRGIKEGEGFDLAGTCAGIVDLKKIIAGQNIQEGDALIGLASSGLHSNGYTLARRVLIDGAKYKVKNYVKELGRTLGEELLEPTKIYVKPVLEILKKKLCVKALAHITGGGFLNLNRVASPSGFVIEHLPQPQPVFSLIQKHGNIDDAEMYRTFNMGTGFCIVVSPRDADSVLSVMKKHRVKSFVLGYAFKDKQHRIYLKPKKLVGIKNKFSPEL